MLTRREFLQIFVAAAAGVAAGILLTRQRPEPVALYLTRDASGVWGITDDPREAEGVWVEAVPGVLGIRPGRPREAQMHAAPRATLHLY
jgi:hypothetical protein